MKKQLLFAVAFFFLLMIIVQNVNAQPPLQQNLNGLTLEIPISETHQQNTNLSLHAHIYNETGQPVSQSSLSCFYNLYSHQSSFFEIAEGTMSPSIDGVGFTSTINSGNFSNLGGYSFVVWCNSTTQGGFFDSYFLVTPTGQTTTTAQGLLYGLLILASMFFLFVCLYGAFTINGQNEFSMGGDLIRVNFNKYYKGFLFLIAYLFAIFTSYLSWQVSAQFLLLDLGTAIFKTIFNILWIGFFPIMILLIIVGFVKWLADVELHKLAERGLKPR